jgi:hypothetical protein
MRLLEPAHLLRSSLLSTASLLALAGCQQPSADEGNETSSGIEGPGDGDGDTNETSASMSMSGDGDGDSGDGDGDSGDGDGDDTDTDGGGPKFDVLTLGDAGSGDCGPGDVDDASLTGTVYAPNGVIPVGGALVYVTNSPPDPIPDGVYCAECVELECGIDFTETDIDGSFTLGANSGGGKYLVVQKG